MFALSVRRRAGSAASRTVRLLVARTRTPTAGFQISGLHCGVRPGLSGPVPSEAVRSRPAARSGGLWE